MRWVSPKQMFWACWQQIWVSSACHGLKCIHTSPPTVKGSELGSMSHVSWGGMMHRKQTLYWSNSHMTCLLARADASQENSLLEQDCKQYQHSWDLTGRERPPTCTGSFCHENTHIIFIDVSLEFFHQSKSRLNLTDFWSHNTKMCFMKNKIAA